MEKLQKQSVKLTIAIPVYNVEQYLRRCLDSIVTQYYMDKEVLIVNDGSKDNCVDIIKEYADKYDFIRYIDQPNKGLAEVRNICIKEAKGDYISFIDSDDYVLDGLYGHLMPIIIDNNVDVMCFGVINLYENNSDASEILNVNTNGEEIKTYTVKEALDELLLPNNIDVITCNKIIKRSLYEGILYPAGKLYEDMFTNYKIIAKANNICSTNYKYYVYCHRGSSIGGMKYTDRTMDLYIAFTEVYKYCLKNGLSKPKHLNVGYATWLVVVLNIMIRSKHNDLDYKTKVANFIKAHIKEVNRSVYLNKTRKIQMNLLIKCYPLYKLVYCKYLSLKR